MQLIQIEKSSNGPMVYGRGNMRITAEFTKQEAGSEITISKFSGWEAPVAPLTIYDEDFRRTSLKSFTYKSDSEVSVSFIIDEEQVQDEKEVARFLSKNEENDVGLIVGTDTIYAKKDVLVTNSSYFQTLFKEQGAELVEIGEDVTSEEVLALVMILSKANYYICNSNVSCLMRIADRFNVKWLVNDCAAYVARHCKLPVLDRLTIIDEYSTEHLIKMLISSLEPSEIIVASTWSGLQKLNKTTRLEICSKAAFISGKALESLVPELRKLCVIGIHPGEDEDDEDEYTDCDDCKKGRDIAKNLLRRVMAYLT